jgi:signal transduction histidine kinase
MSDFRALEQTEIQKSLQRVNDTYQVNVNDTLFRANDWGQWTEAYRFVQGENPQFREDNLTDENNGVLNLNYIMYLNKEREIVHEDYFNRVIGEHSDFSPATKDILLSQQKLFNHVSDEDSVAGMLEVAEGNIVLASRGLTDSNFTAPFAGSVFFAYIFDQEDVQTLSDVTQLEVSFMPRSTFAVSVSQSIIDEVQKSPELRYMPAVDDDAPRAIGYFGINDINGHLVGIFKVEEQRNTFLRGQASVELFGRWMLLFSILFIFITLLVMEVLVLRKLTRLNRQVKTISAQDEINERISLSGSDEISELAESINQANERTQTQKERAESILNFLRSIGEGVFATDLEERVIFINNTAENFVSERYQKGTFQLARDLFYFTDSNKEDEEKNFDPLAGVLKKQKIKVFPDHAFLRQGDKQVPVAGTSSPIRNQDDEIVGTITVFQDITERHELDKLKDSFISVAAHQLRTPLGSMRWSMELLLNNDLGELPKPAYEVLQTLYQNSERMRLLVNDLLNTSRIEQNRGQEEKVAVSLKQLLQVAVDTLLAEAQKKNLEVMVEFTKASLPAIMAPTKHLQEAFLNLLSNAIKYNKKKGKISVSLEEVPGAQVVKIRDTGIGIPMADQDKVFSKFYRASNAVHTDTDSSGLGLFVVKSYIDEAGAKIDLQSQEGRGTLVTITFPYQSTNS